MQDDIKIPLFPLGVVLLPGTPLPLHIFEERYKIMIRECLDQDKEFGIVFTDDKETRKKGCTARVIKVIKRYDDGRMDILARGERRFTIQDISDEKPYLQATVVYFDDAVEKRDEGLNQLVTGGIHLLEEVDGMTGKKGDYSSVPNLDLKTASFLIANSDGFTAEEKQIFLEMTSTRERIIKSVKSLKKIIERLKISQEIRKIIGGNGDLKKKMDKKV